ERWLAAVCTTPSAAPPPWQPLEACELLVEHRPPPVRELAFRHGALQEVLYEGMLQKQRQAEHARIAPVVAAEAEARSEMAAAAAWHWRRAANPEEALTWSLRAADHASALFAAAEAGELYREALELATARSDWSRAARAATGLAELAALRGEFP